jgi:hypothetical protein
MAAAAASCRALMGVDITVALDENGSCCVLRCSAEMEEGADGEVE